MSIQYKLYLKVEDEALKSEYKKRVEAWNNNLNSQYPDSGFDLLCSETVSFASSTPPATQSNKHFTTQLVDLKVKAAAYKIIKGDIHQTIVPALTPQAYTLNVRSSIYKTPFRLSNNVGIIDSGYRGNLMAAVDCHDTGVEMKRHNRYFQICMPTLEPFEIEVVETLDSTARGTGGHGSTGK